MHEKILLPIDLPQAEIWTGVIERRSAWRSAFSAELHVLWVVPSLERNLRRLPEDRKPELDAFVERRFPDDVEVKGHLRASLNAPHRAIRATAEELGIDVVVIGAQSPRFGERFMGSNASQVALHVKCSVFVVRCASPPRGPKAQQRENPGRRAPSGVHADPSSPQGGGGLPGTLEPHD